MPLPHRPMPLGSISLALLLLGGCPGAGNPNIDYDEDGTEDSQDCDPTDDSIYPGAQDLLGDDIDQNCDGIDGVDQDGDGWADGPDCADLQADINPDAEDPYGDNLDTNCDGVDGVLEGDDDDSGDDDDDTEPAFADLSGQISRSIAPTEDGVGDLYISVLDQSPITNPGGTILGFALLPQVDLSATDSSVEFTITGLPIRPEPYFVFAFLDDNDNASAVYALPDGADLVSFVVGAGVQVPQVTLDEEGVALFDVVLNMVYPL